MEHDSTQSGSTDSAESLDLIPDDVLCHIFAAVPDEYDYISLSLCGRRFYWASMRSEPQKTVASFSIRKFFASYRFSDDMEMNLNIIDSWAFQHRPRGESAAPETREPYVAGDAGDSIKDRLARTIRPGLPILTSARATLATLRRTQNNSRGGKAHVTNIYSKLHMNSCTIVGGNLYLGGGRHDDSEVQKWTLSNDHDGKETSLSTPTKTWHRRDGCVSGLTHVGERLIYGTWAGKIMTCDLDFGSRTPVGAWNNGMSIEALERLGQTQIIAAGNHDEVIVFDATHVAHVYSGSIPQGSVWVIDGNPKNSSLFVGGNTKGRVYQWDTRSPNNRPVLSISVASQPSLVRGLRHRDHESNQLLCSTDEGPISLWDIRNTETPINHIRPPINESNFFRSPLELWGCLFIPSSIGDIYVYDARSLSFLYVIDKSAADVQFMATDGRRLVTTCNTGAVRIFDFIAHKDNTTKIAKAKSKGQKKQGRSGFVKMRPPY